MGHTFFSYARPKPVNASCDWVRLVGDTLTKFKCMSSSSSLGLV